jgi:hypothetical protein
MFFYPLNQVLISGPGSSEHVKNPRSILLRHFELQSGRFTSPRSTFHKSYVFCTMLQFCCVFYTTFSLSPFFQVSERCTKYTQNVHHCTFLCVYSNIVRNTLRVCKVVYFQCIWCNILRPGSMCTVINYRHVHPCMLP